MRFGNLDRDRAAAAGALVDRCRVLLPDRSAATLDPVTLKLTPVDDDVWAGPCRVQVAQDRGRTLDPLGGGLVQHPTHRIRFPVDVDVVAEGMVVVITGCVDDEALVGAEFVVMRVEERTAAWWRTAWCDRTKHGPRT